MQRITFRPRGARLPARSPSRAVGLGGRRLQRRRRQRPRPGTPRQYNQIQRLGNPLVSEVLLAKRSHPTHGTSGPDRRRALIGARDPRLPDRAGQRGRPLRPTTPTCSARVLLPDVLVVYTDRDPATAGWLTWLPQLGSRVRRPEADRRRGGPRAAGGLRRPVRPRPGRRGGQGRAHDRQRRLRLPGAPGTFPYLGDPN